MNFKEMNKSASSTMRKKNMLKLINNKLALIGTICILLILIASLVVPLFLKFNYADVNIAYGAKAPNAVHLFGTDKLGRDLFARVLVGGRYSILIGVVGALGGAAIGMILGSISGYLGGKVDWTIVRISEIFQTFPEIVLVLIIVALMGRGMTNMLIIFPLTGWMTTYRMVRNEFLTLKNETYVQVCKSFGMSKARIMFQQIMPNVISPITVAATVNVSTFILEEAALSYLGLGVSDATPTWGNILNAAKSVDVISNYWWMWVIPGLMITAFVLAINFFGDGLRDVVDPKQQ